MDLLQLLVYVSSLTLSDPTPPLRWSDRGVASVFYTGKDGRHAGGYLACLWRHPRKKQVDRALRFVAHRTLPCGSIVLVHNPRTQRSTYAVVLDRGPYGGVHEGAWVLKLRRSDPGVWRGKLDLSPGTAEAIQHNGFERVNFLVLRRGADPN